MWATYFKVDQMKIISVLCQIALQFVSEGQIDKY